MEIQRNYAPSFGAVKVLKVTNGNEAMDIFKLNISDKNDINFIKKCRQALGENSSKKNMSAYFDRFLQSKTSCYEGNYYLGIKNGESIHSGFETKNAGDTISYRKLGFTNDYKRFTTDCWLYSLISDAQKTNPNKSITDDTLESSLLKRYNTDTVHSNEIDKLKAKIESKYPKASFVDNDRAETNLEEFLGINDIESQIIPQ